MGDPPGGEDSGRVGGGDAVHRCRSYGPGLGRRERLRLLWRRRLLAIGFGVAVFFLFLVPLGALLGMPGAIAGGTQLARRLAPAA